MEKKIQTQYTKEIVCPHCGYESINSWEYTQNSGKEECPECYEEFVWQREITIDYSTSKK